jgi:hypothetical protein
MAWGIMSGVWYHRQSAAARRPLRGTTKAMRTWQ